MRVEATPPTFDGVVVFQPKLQWSIVAEFDTVEAQLAFSAGLGSVLSSDAQLRDLARKVMDQEAGEPDGTMAIVDLNSDTTMSDACAFGEALHTRLGGAVDIYILDAR